MFSKPELAFIYNEVIMNAQFHSIVAAEWLNESMNDDDDDDDDDDLQQKKLRQSWCKFNYLGEWIRRKECQEIIVDCREGNVAGLLDQQKLCSGWENVLVVVEAKGSSRIDDDDEEEEEEEENVVVVDDGIGDDPDF